MSHLNHIVHCFLFQTHILFNLLILCKIDNPTRWNDSDIVIVLAPKVQTTYPQYCANFRVDADETRDKYTSQTLNLGLRIIYLIAEGFGDEGVLMKKIRLSSKNGRAVLTTKVLASTCTMNEKSNSELIII